MGTSAACVKLRLVSWIWPMETAVPTIGRDKLAIAECAK
jgi:hypothetical protein